MLAKILYYLILKPISYLPLQVTYRLSDLTYLILYRIVGYRKQVVWSNISNSFPQMDKKKRRKIMNKFYHHFCDLIFESIHLFSISENELNRRVKYTNPHIFDKYYKNKVNLIITGGHYNNWEYAAISFDLPFQHKAAGIYAPLSNSFFNKRMYASRNKFGTDLIARSDVKKYFSNIGDRPTAIIFAIDQSPTYARKVYWTQFLNQDTAVAFGAERYSKLYDLPVLFTRIYKVKRGYYEIEFIEITDCPEKEAHGQITEKTTRALEELIHTKPQYWLWTHKRWKRKRKEGE